jgi:hypothetical protein
MKYLKFTHVDALTGVSVAAEPAMNGAIFPAVAGLEFAWARESAYPTPVPELFGTCPDDSATQVDGVLGVFVQSDWEQMQRDEMNARSHVPKAVSMRQACVQLEIDGLLDDVEAIVATLPRVYQIEWQRASTVSRDNPLVEMARQQQGMTAEQIDALFIAAAAL